MSRLLFCAVGLLAGATALPTPTDKIDNRLLAISTAIDKAANVTAASVGVLDNNLLNQCLVDKKWRTVSDLATMSADDKRNTAIVELSHAGEGSISYMQSKNNNQLKSLCDGCGCGKGVLDKCLIRNQWRTKEDVAGMTENNKRNTVIIEMDKLVDESISDLQGKNTGQLVNMCKRLNRHRADSSTRLVYTNSGGGFAAMTGGMGILRAMHEAGALDQVSYVGGNSGGNWLLTQLVYSEKFYDSIIDDNTPIDTVIENWGVKYTEAMADFPGRGTVDTAWSATKVLAPRGLINLLASIDFRRLSVSTCPIGGDKIAELLKVITDRVDIPATDFRKYIGQMLEDTLGTEFGNGANYGSLPRNGKADVTYVQQVAVPPDVFTNSPAGWKATLGVEFKTATATEEYNKYPTMALPAAYYSTPDDQTGWLYNEDIKQLSITSDPVRAVGRLFRGGNKFDARLPSNPAVLDVTAASSAAGGFLASPTLLKAFLDSALESIDFTDRLSFNNAATRSVLAFGLSRCLATPMKDVAIAQSGMGDGINVSPDYKFIDGGFTENTGIASTLGKVAADFPTDDYLGKFVHFDLDMTMGENRVQALFKLDSDNSNCNTQVTGAAGEGYCTNPKALGQHNANTGRPSSLIFDDKWPSNLGEDWTPYAYWTDANGVTTHSYYFKKKVTTVKNQFYKVPAGKTLDLLVFSLNQPPSDPIVVGGGTDDWKEIWGPIAKAQAAGAKKIIEEFMDE